MGKGKEKIEQIKGNMTKRRVYTLYGDAGAIGMAIAVLVKNNFHFHYTGELLYDSEPWDGFIEGFCADFKDRLTAREETWIDEGFQTIKL